MFGSVHAPSTRRTTLKSIVAFCLLASLLLAPLTTAWAKKKGDKNYKQGLAYETAQQWERAAQEYALAVAADPSRVEFQLHYRRALFEASQTYMQRGRELAERQDFVGAYNAFRQSAGYDPINELASSEMQRMLRLQREKQGLTDETDGDGTADAPGVPSTSGDPRQIGANDPSLPPLRQEQPRTVNVAPGTDLKGTIKQLAEQIGLNVLFDPTTFRSSRTTELQARDITVAQALDLLFLQENLFFQKVSRNVILVADQNRRSQYQQLAIRTFYLKNADPEKVKTQLQSMIPQGPGRPIPSVMSNQTTNSLTIRDTPENLKVFSKIIESIDKDRAEVVMDVRIYEVTHTDFLQIGNNFGTNLGGSSGLSILSGSGEVAQRLTGIAPTALGAAFVLPASTITALQSKDNTRLVFQTQLHAFDNEESTADVGQKVPIQTASFPGYGGYPTNQTGTGTGGVINPGGGLGGYGGYPISQVQYTDVGLKLKFKPQIYPNRDVQVLMNITSSSLASGGDVTQNLTPTISQRVITGTARIPNNRTMLVANIAQNQEIRGQKGLPLLSLIPYANRLFTSPTRNNVQSDIVLVVTPHVLRAPDITPSDVEARSSGTMNSPTTESLAQVLQQEARDEQLAAIAVTRREQARAARSAKAKATQGTETVAATSPTTQAPEDAPRYLPAPKILVGIGEPPTNNNQTPANATASVTPPVVPTAFRNAQPVAARNADLPLIAAAAKSALKGGARLSMMGEAKNMGQTGAEEMAVGQRQRIALSLHTDAPLALAMLKLKYDPRMIVVRAVTPGTLLTPEGDAAASSARLTQSINRSGEVLLSASASAANSLAGAGVLVFLEIEALAKGNSRIAFDTASVRLIGADGREVPVEALACRLIVK